MARGGTYGQMDEQTNERTENLPILQDFVPYWGRAAQKALNHDSWNNISC